jgi:hypothetical protein
MAGIETAGRSVVVEQTNKSDPTRRRPSPGPAKSGCSQSPEYVLPATTQQKGSHGTDTGTGVDIAGNLDEFPDGGWRAWSVVFGVWALYKHVRESAQVLM